MKSYIFIEPKLEARQLLPRSEEDHSRSSGSDIVTHSPFTDFLILPTKLKSTFSMWLAVIWLAGFTQLPKIRAGLFFYSVHLEIKSCLPVPSCKKFWRLRKPLFIIAVECYWFLNLLTLLCNKMWVFRTRWTLKIHWRWTNHLIYQFNGILCLKDISKIFKFFVWGI